jgi:hypothetical protein
MLAGRRPLDQMPAPRRLALLEPTSLFHCAKRAFYERQAFSTGWRILVKEPAKYRSK